MKKKSAKTPVLIQDITSVNQLLASQQLIDIIENLKINLPMMTHLMVICRDRHGQYHTQGKLPCNLESLRVITKIENSILYPNEFREG